MYIHSNNFGHKKETITGIRQFLLVLILVMLFSFTGETETLQEIGGVHFRIDIFNEKIELLKNPSFSSSVANIVNTPDSGIVRITVLDCMNEFVLARMFGKEGWLHRSYLDESPLNVYVESPAGKLHFSLPLPENGRVHQSTETIQDIRIEYEGWLLTFPPPMSRLPLIDNEAEYIPSGETWKPGKPVLKVRNSLYVLARDSLFVFDRKGETPVRSLSLGSDSSKIGRDRLYLFGEFIIATGFSSSDKHPVMSISLSTGKIKSLTGPIRAAVKISEKELLLFLFDKKTESFKRFHFLVASGRKTQLGKPVIFDLNKVSPVHAPEGSPGYIIYSTKK